MTDRKVGAGSALRVFTNVDFKTFRAVKVLGLMKNDALSLAGLTALEEGFDTPESRELAGLDSNENPERALELFDKIVEQFEPLSLDQAALWYARKVSQAILSGA